MTSSATDTLTATQGGLASERGQWLLRHVLVPSGLYLLAWAVLTWPQVTRFVTYYYCDDGDGYQNIWNIWWMRLAIAQRSSTPWFTDMLFWPNGVSLVAHTLNPFNGMLAIPLSVILPDMVVYNVLIVLNFVLSGLTTYWLCYWLTNVRWSSLLAGAYFTFSPFHFAHSGSHLQLATLQWIPLFVLCFLRIFENPGWKTGLGAGVALLLVEASDWYFTLFSILAGTIITAWACVSARRFLPLMVGYRAAFLTLAATAIGPLVWFLSQLKHLHTGTAELWGGHDPERFSANLLGPLVPGPTWVFGEWTRNWFWGMWPGENAMECVAYYGWVVTAIAGYALLTRRKASHQPGVWVALIGVFFLLSLGPQLYVLHFQLGAVPMPYRLLETVVPTLKLSGCPGRFGVIATLGLAVLLSMGCAVAARTFLRPMRTRILLSALALLELWPAAPSVTQPAWPDILRVLRDFPDGAVHWHQDPGLESELMLWQTRFQKPITSGYVSRIRPETMMQRWDICQLVAAGRYSEAKAKGKFRYLVLPAGRVDTNLEREWKPVHFGSQHTIWASRSDTWISAANRPKSGGEAAPDPDRLALTVEVVGPSSVDMNIEARNLAGRRVVMGLARARRAPFELPGGAQLELEPDAWLRLSSTAPQVLFGAVSFVLDARGRTTVRMSLPARGEIQGLQLNAQAFVLCPDPTSGFCASSPPVTFRLAL